MIASYFYNESQKDKLTVVVKNMINRHVRDALKEFWNHIQTSIMRSSTQEALGLHKYTLDTVMNMMEDPKLHSLKATRVWEDEDRTVTGRPTLDLKTLTGPQLAEIRLQMTQFKNTYLSENSERINFYIDKLIQSTFTEADLKDIIDYDLSSADDECFWSYRDRGGINIFFLDYLFEVKKSGSTEFLRPYLLRA